MAVDRVFNSVPYDEFILPPEVWQDEIILHLTQSHFCQSAVARQMQVISGTIAKVDINYMTACYVPKTMLHYRAVSMSAQWEERNYGSQTKKTALDGGQRPEGKLGYQPNPVFPPDFDFAEAANLTDQLLQQVRPRHKKRTIDDEPLHRWIQEIDSYLVELLRLEAQTGSEICGGCEQDQPAVFCCCSCFNGRNLCWECIVNEHQDTPFHRIEDVGLKVQLGHLSGETCPYPQASGRSVIVIDVEGIHKINMMSFMSKVSGYEYYQSLARLHDNTGSLMLPDLYQVFLHVVREWRHIQMLKRHGRGNDLSGSEGTKVGDCVVHCLACPRSGVNLSGNRKKEDIWLDRLFVSVDANFRLKQFNVLSDCQDPHLNKGYSYFIDSEIVNAHMKKFEDKIVEEKSTCNDHDTVKLATMRGGKGMSTKAPKEVVIAYDIGCQWGKNLWKRINVYGPDLTPPQKQKDIVILVPKFHLPVHIVECQEEFSFAFELFVGETDGEATEWTWAISNPVASSMREMGPGSRQDTLDDHWSDHNWRKNAGLHKCSTLFHLQKMAKFDYRNGQSRWNHGSDTVQVEKKSKIHTFQQSNMTLTMASVHLQLSEEGLDAQWGASTGTLISANKMIADGLLAEQAQLDLQKEMKALGPHSTDIQRVKVLDKTSRLQQEINSWMEVQLVYMPEVCSIHGEEDHAAGGECVVAWNIDLLLPSSLLMKHNILCDKQLLHYEWELRCAQAMEALGIVRQKVILETYIVNHKGVYGHGQKIGTASNNLLDIEDAVLIAGLKQRKKRDTSSKETLGESTAPQLSWIWLIAGAVDNSTPEGLQDTLRIEWCKLRARMQRWDEECCLLHEEMQRVLRSHEYNIKLWSDRAERSIKGTVHGARAYAFRQAFIHKNEGAVDDADLLGEESESHVTAILGSERS
ncbi:hypothetical protein EDD18DRAFT_1115246 [Armillaria luteobubalina]|uniref:CxC2-like cysteine cluster KDZ transposase-associated domain-containing protein n=1 Tax=Armillaria luteobubalina TaxID=153913 RepID=A0AA39UBU0_9AGAR|nr:hypothetical protein EDD18DRAFT_1115246 [Armillaria luteobubalina]